MVRKIILIHVMRRTLMIRSSADEVFAQERLKGNNNKAEIHFLLSGTEGI